MTREEIEALISDIFAINPYDASEYIPDLAATALAALDREAKLIARAAELEKRLEIDHLWRITDNGEAMERVGVPPEERAAMPDGIECRDETIELLDERIAELEVERDALRAQLSTARAETWEAAAHINVPQTSVTGTDYELGYLRAVAAYRTALRAKAKEERG